MHLEAENPTVPPPALSATLVLGMREAHDRSRSHQAPSDPVPSSAPSPLPPPEYWTPVDEDGPGRVLATDLGPEGGPVAPLFLVVAIRQETQHPAGQEAHSPPIRLLAVAAERREATTGREGRCQDLCPPEAEGAAAVEVGGAGQGYVGQMASAHFRVSRGRGGTAATASGHHWDEDRPGISLHHLRLDQSPSASEVYAR